MAGSTKKKTSSSSKKSSSKPGKAAEPPEAPFQPMRREISAVLFAFLAVFVTISYFNSEGSFIIYFSNLLKGLVGWGFWLVAPSFFLVAVILGFHQGKPVAGRVWAALFIPVVFSAIANLLFYVPPETQPEFKQYVAQLFVEGQSMLSGGAVGGVLAVYLTRAFSIYGAVPLLLVALVFCLLYSLNRSLSTFFSKLGKQAKAKYDPAMYEKPEPVTKPTSSKQPVAENKRRPVVVDIPLGDDEDELPLRRFEAEKAAAAAEPKKAKVSKKAMTDLPIAPQKQNDGVDVGDGFKEYTLLTKTKAASVPMTAEISDPPKPKKMNRTELEAEAKAVETAVINSESTTDYQYPPVELLRSGPAIAIDSRDEISLNRERLENALRSFGISAGIVGVTRGPTVTRYDIELEQGVKLMRVTNLAGDLALALGVVNVRIAPIPDKISTVGIEVPNKIVSTVYLRDIIESPKFVTAKSKLSFALGKDIGGDCIVGNISKLPHMLIAGTTGSGKSVCMNSLIISLLYKARPDEVRFIMIDPKMVELGVYNGIPHLYVPVVTDPKKAAGALQWSVVEMMKRYRLFSDAGVRDLASYNKCCAGIDEQPLPQVVVVIDELADLMLVASRDVEESICRVAQMGRAAGVHLIIATQRPSADVITGLMKANIPSRIAFAVSSAMESRIILDQGGAEKLVGMGDMLFAPLGSGKPTRVQGAFVSDDEREEVIRFIKESASGTQENSEIEEFMNKAAEGKGQDAGSDDSEPRATSAFDEQLPQAVDVVLEMKSCSVSMLQRRVKLGYSRAARVVDQMEELGIVGPSEGAKPRAVLIDKNGWHELQIRLGIIPDDSPNDFAGTDDEEESE